jgi:hypothetical protein
LLGSRPLTDAYARYMHFSFKWSETLDLYRSQFSYILKGRQCCAVFCPLCSDCLFLSFIQVSKGPVLISRLLHHHVTPQSPPLDPPPLYPQTWPHRPTSTSLLRATLCAPPLYLNCRGFFLLLLPRLIGMRGWGLCSFSTTDTCCMLTFLEWMYGQPGPQSSR